MSKEGQTLRRTKIICTIGPSSSALSTLRKMAEAGMDVARINFSHGNYESHLATITAVREAAQAVGRPIALMLDLQGPKVRVGELPEDGLELTPGVEVVIRAGAISAGPGEIPVPYDRLAVDVKRGDRILLDDGRLELEVWEAKRTLIRCKVVLGGRLLARKGIVVPSRTLMVESFTKKDEEDLAFGLKHHFDFVALSYVREAADVVAAKAKIEQLLPDDVEAPALIAKIEKHQALAHMDEIIEEADAVMVARGDLGLETKVSAVPLYQKELIAKSLVATKPVIVATHMLDSMQDNPRPTRAEVSDVANAVIDHTDAVMLSAETAGGNYPVRTVETMAKILTETEESPLDDLKPHRDARGEPISSAVAAAAVEIARHIEAAAMLVTTHSGYSARAVARYRPEVPVYAATDRPRTRQQLMLSWGITPIDVDGYEEPREMVMAALGSLEKQKVVTRGSTLVVVSGLKRALGGYDSVVRVLEL